MNARTPAARTAQQVTRKTPQSRTAALEYIDRFDGLPVHCANNRVAMMPDASRNHALHQLRVDGAAGVDNSHRQRTCSEGVECAAVSVVVVCENGDVSARQNRILICVTAQGSSKHYAGLVVVGEHQWSLNTAGRHDYSAGSQVNQALSW